MLEVVKLRQCLTTSAIWVF